MPIEFSCDACNRLLRVPDGSEGSQCECPACQTLLEIPGAEVPILEEAPADQRLRIECPDCSHMLLCDRTLEGTKGQCKNCELVFLISSDPAKVKASVAQSESLVFSCPKCEQLFDGDRSMKGRKGKCHACGEVFEIKLRKKKKKKKKNRKIDLAKAPSPTPSNAPAPAAPQAAPPAQAPSPAPAPTPNIQLSCFKCQGVMEVPGSAAGQKTACPYCHIELLIPTPGAPVAPTPAPAPTPSPQPSSSSSGGLWDAYDQQQATSPNQGGTDLFADVPSTGADYSAGLDDMSGAANDPFGGDPYGNDYGGGDAYGNPYEAPAGSSYEPSGGYAPSTAAGLTFTNAFTLFFEQSYPNLLVSSLIYIVTTVLATVMVYGGLFVVGLSGAALNLQGAALIALLIVFGLFVIGIMLVVSSFVVSMLANGALATIRNKQTPMGELFSTGNIAGPITGYLLILLLFHVGFAALQQANIQLLGPSLGSIALLPSIVLIVIESFLMLAISLAPYAMLDGRGILQAMNESAAIYGRNFLPMTAVSIVAGIILVILVFLSCGIGSLLITAAPFYMGAVFYELGRE